MNRTIAQLAADDDRYAWLTERYLRRLIYEGRLPYSKVGGRILVDTDDLDALVAAGRVDAAA